MIENKMANSVEYRIQQNSSMNDEFSKLFKETYEFFQQKHNVSILGEGIKDVLSDQNLFIDYVDSLVESVNATDAENLRTVLENARTNTFLESTTAGISPVASLTFPTIRKLWAKTGLINAVPTEAVKSNAFSVAFNKPYILDENGDKHYLPEALDDINNTYGQKKGLKADKLTLPLEAHDLLGDVGCSKATGDSIDRDFALVEVTFTDGKVVTIPRVKGKIDINNKIYVEVSNGDDSAPLSDIIFGYVDLSNGTMDAVSLKGNVTDIKIKGYVATDAHNRATNISFEIERRDFTIGTGEHFEASLPLEYLQDAMATYNIDGTSEVVDTMSNVIAQTLDQEIYKFLMGVYEGTGRKYLGEFDLRPSAAFNGQPKDWREEIKTVFDHFATKLKSESHAYQGYFALIGNPIDMEIIPNVSWTFNHVTDTQDGVDVGYNVGAISGQNRYTLVSSDLVPAGGVIMLFIPTTNKFMSVKYYPYTFNVVNNYLNTQRTNVPSIMMTKRQTIEEFLPLIGYVQILNNDGKLPR